MCFQRLHEETMSYENKKLCFRKAEVLLEYGADINWIVNKVEGHTFLMDFCASLRETLSKSKKKMILEAMKFLIEKGASKEIRSLSDLTCLDMAKESPYRKEIIGIFQEAEVVPKKTLKRARCKPLAFDIGKIQEELDRDRI